jgi:hypothetical protein
VVIYSGGKGPRRSGVLDYRKRSPNVNAPVGHNFRSWWRKLVKRHIIDDDPQNRWSQDVQITEYPFPIRTAPPRTSPNQTQTDEQELRDLCDEEEYRKLCIEFTELRHIWPKTSDRSNYRKKNEDLKAHIRYIKEEVNSRPQQLADMREMRDKILQLKAAAAFARKR